MTKVILRGRSAEMDQVLRAATRVVRDRRGATLVVTGERGIGKTALVEAAVAQARRSGFRAAAANAAAASQMSPGAPILLALRSGTDPLLGSPDLTALTALVPTPLLLVDRIAGHLDDLATAAPLLLAIDDVEQADRLSRFLIRELADRLAGRPVLWLLSSRERDLPGLPASATVRLRPLPRDDAMALARDRLGTPAPPRLRRLIDRVHGNPALLRLLVDGVEAGPEDDESLPADVITGIQRDLARIDPPAQTLVRALSVLGRPVMGADLGMLLDRADDVGPGMDAAIGAGLLEVRDGAVVLRHDLIGDAVRAGMTERHRHLLELQGARYLTAVGDSPETAARLAAAAADAGNEEAVTILRHAAAHLVVSNPASAAEFILRAFRGVGADDPDRIELGAECLDLLIRAEHATEAIRTADLLIGRVTDPERRARLRAASARAYWLSGRAADGLRRLAQVTGDEPAGPLRAARALLEGATTTGTETGAAGADPVIVAQTRAEAATCRGDHLAALAHLRGAGDVLLGHEILTLQALDRHDEAGTLLDRAGSTTDRLPSLGYARLTQAFDLNRFDEADRLAHMVMARSGELGDHRYGVAAAATYVAAALVRGDLVRARERLTAAESSAPADESVRTAALTPVRGWLLAAGGHLDEAVELLAEPLYAIGRQGGHWLWQPGWTRMLTHIGLVAGDERFTIAAVEIAEQAAARNPGVPSLDGTAAQLRGLVDNDLDLVARGADLLDRSPRPVMRAGGHEDYGRALLAAGRRQEGVERLDRAWNIYRSVGAQPKIEGIRRELRGIGIRRPRGDAAQQPESGWGVLSEAEVRVARLIAGGHSNRLAARELGLSINTIGSHLRSIFAKLGIQSRVQLANLVYDRAAPHQFT